MAKLTAAGYRFPEPAEGSRVNFCKNVRCAAFGVPEKPHRVRRSKFATAEAGDYIREGSTDDIRLKCALCSSRNPVRSNEAILEELRRVSSISAGCSSASCPSPECDNHDVPVTEPGRYARFGKTKVGSPRWRCNSCKKTFSEAGKPLLRQRMPHKNRDVFMLLVNKSPLSRIAEITGLDIKTVYGKIDFISRQCKAFVTDRERHLYEGMPLPLSFLLGFETCIRLPGNFPSRLCDVSTRPVSCSNQFSTKVPIRGFCASVMGSIHGFSCGVFMPARR